MPVTLVPGTLIPSSGRHKTHMWCRYICMSNTHTYMNAHMCIHFILRVKKGKEKKGFLAVTKSGHISKKLMFAECCNPPDTLTHSTQ